MLVCVFSPRADGKEIDPSILKDVKSALQRLEKDGPEENELFEEMKTAGASYIPELSADPKKIDSLVGPEQQRTMVGVYLMDMSYAFAFGKNKESLQYADATNRLTDKLGFANDKIIKEYQKAVQDPDSAEAKAVFKNLEKTIENSFEEVISTPAGFDLAVDAVYGWLIEGLYISSEIAAQTNYDPKFIKFVNDQKPTINVMTGLFNSIKNSPHLEEISEKEERLAVLSKIAGALSAPAIGKKEIDEVRAIVTEVRKAIVL